MAGMTIELSEYVIDAIADAVVKKMQEPKTDGDCISRQAVLDMVEDMTDQFGNKHRVVTEGLISMLSPVTSKSKTGWWIEEPNCWTRCSCCGEHYPQTSIYGFIGSNYCPNCGAKMSESEE